LKVVLDILDQEGCTIIVKHFNEVLRNRQKIAHTERFLDYSNLSSEVEHFTTPFSEVGLLEKMFEKQKMPKAELNKMLEKMTPFIVFMFLHYFKISPFS